MKLEQLEFLLKIQETKSIQKTSDYYLISRQAVSKSIKQLEEELQVTLLKRTPNSITLTENGERVCIAATQIISIWKNMRSDLFFDPESSSKVHNVITIFASPRFFTTSFITFVQNLRDSEKKVALNIHSAPSEYLLNDLYFGQETLGLHCIYNLELHDYLSQIKTKNLSYRQISTVELFICVHNTSPLAKKDCVSQKDLEKYTSVSFNLHESIGLSLNTFEQQKAFLKKGNYFGYVSQKEYNNEFSKSYKLIPYEEPIKFHYIAFFLPEHSVVIDYFCDRLQKIL